MGCKWVGLYEKNVCVSWHCDEEENEEELNKLST
jgi:hypothetical protein